MKDLSDADLMCLAAGDNDLAFAELVRRYQDVLLNFFLRTAVSYSDGQDLAQRTLLRLWRYRKKYTAKDAKFTTFLFMMARQVSIDFFRAETRRRELEVDLEQAAAAEPIAVPGRRGADAVSGEAISRAMGRLTPSLRETVELVVFQDLPYVEAAEVLGVPLGTVKSRLFNALRKLKGYLGNERRS